MNTIWHCPLRLMESVNAVNEKSGFQSQTGCWKKGYERQKRMKTLKISEKKLARVLLLSLALGASGLYMIPDVLAAEDAITTVKTSGTYNSIVVSSKVHDVYPYIVYGIRGNTDPMQGTATVTMTGDKEITVKSTKDYRNGMNINFSSAIGVSNANVSGGTAESPIKMTVSATRESSDDIYYRSATAKGILSLNGNNSTISGDAIINVTGTGGEVSVSGASGVRQAYAETSGVVTQTGGSTTFTSDVNMATTSIGGTAIGAANQAYANTYSASIDASYNGTNIIAGDAVINTIGRSGTASGGSLVDTDSHIWSIYAFGGGTNTIAGDTTIHASATGGTASSESSTATANAEAYGVTASNDYNDASNTNTIGGKATVYVTATGGTASSKSGTVTADAVADGLYAANRWYGLNDTNIINGDAVIHASAIGGSISGQADTSTATATASGLYAGNGGTNTIKGNAAIMTDATATQSGQVFHAYSLDATDGGINDVSSTGKTKILSGDVYATSAGVNKLVLDTAGSYLQGNIIDGDGTGDNEISISNGAEWRPVYDNTNGTDCVVNTDANAANINVKSNTVNTRSADALNLYDGGVVNLLWDGNKNTYRTLNLGTLSGNGGVFNIATDLASQTNGDKINVTTGEAGSTQYITVYDASLDTGNIVTGPKQLLVATDESGNYTFAGKELDTGGLWETTPTIENLEGNNWYLTMLAAKPNPSTKGVLGTVDSLYGFWRNTLLDDTLRKRMGDLRYGGEDISGAWARIKAGKMNADLYDGNYQMYQAGYDKKSGHTAYGLAIDYDKASYNVTDGNSDDTGLGLSLYGTTYHDSGFYNDWILRAGKVKAEMDTYGTYPDSLDYSTWCYSLSYELGKTFRHDNGWFIEPQAQLVYGHMRGGDFTTDRGVDVNRDSIDSLLGRVGFVIGRKINDDKDFYFKANVYHEFAGDGDMHLNYDTQNMYYDGDHKDTWFEAGFGANLKMNDSTYLYGDVLKTFGADINKKWQVNLGLRWAFGGPKKEKAVEPASV